MEIKAKLEHIVTPENESFRCFPVEGARFNHPYHYHPEFELTLTTESTGMRLVGDNFCPFGRGDLCLMGENLPHLYRNDKQLKADQTAKAIVLQFRRDCLGGLFDAAEFKPVSEMLDRASRGLTFSFDTATIVLNRLRKLLEVNSHERVILLVEILGFLSRVEGTPLASSGYRPNLNDHRSERVSRACQYIFANFHENISLAGVAQRIGMTPSAFSRLFQRATNHTYRDFLGNVRLGHACRLLLETEMPVTEIAFSTGFNNSSNFNRRFKAALGMTPREFRQRPLN